MNKGKPTVTLQQLNAAVEAAEKEHNEAPPLMKVQTKSKLNRAKAALREFVYHSKQLAGGCNMLRH